MTNMAWDDELNEDSCISYGEWNNMVTWMKDLASYLDDSFCSLGDMGISDCNSIVTNGDLCSRIASTCTNTIKDIINSSYLTSLGVCTLGDMGISACSQIITTENLCSIVSELCEITGSGGYCSTRADSSECIVNNFEGYPGGTTNFWNIFTDCNEEENLSSNVILGVVRYRPEYMRGYEDMQYGYTIIYGGNSYAAEGDRGIDTIRGKNNSLILLPYMPFDENADPSNISPITSDSYCSDYSVFEKVFPRIELGTVGEDSDATIKVLPNISLDVSGSTDGGILTTNKIKFRMQHPQYVINGNDAYEAKALDFINFYAESGGTLDITTIESTVDDADLYLKTTGSGLVKFGTYMEDDGAYIIGYIAIRDADGNTRYLACVEPGGA
jgi:hypothetical protein